MMQLIAWGAFLPSSIFFVKEAIRKEDNIKAQSVLASTTSSGAILSSLLASIIFMFSNINFLMITEIIICIIGTIFAIISIKCFKWEREDI